MIAFIMLLAAAGDGDPTPALLAVEPGLAIWTLIIFSLVLLILSRTAWPAITSALDTREDNIRESMEQAEKALAEARQVQSDNKKALREAEQEAQSILREAREAAERLREEEKGKLQAEIKQMKELAENDIAREKEGAIQALRAEVIDLTVQAAGKIIQENLDDKRQRSMVDKFISELPSN